MDDWDEVGLPLKAEGFREVVISPKRRDNVPEDGGIRI